MNTKTFYTILLITISLFPAWLQAKQVSQETALQVAALQVRSHNQLRSDQTPVLNLIHTETTDSKATNAILKSSEITSTNVIYYVYNIEGNGFVIVSGDDIAVPILGYSDSGTYDPNDLAPNFVYYMNCLAQEIREAIANDLPQSEETKEQWDAYLTGNSLKTTASSTPLLDIEGIQWGQTAPYNGMCPFIKQTQTVTGCVATAMAQIMRYYKYPNQGKGTVASYRSYNSDSTTVITIQSKNLSQSNYNWNIMTPTYPNVVYNGNDPAQNAVALLMYDYGISSKMQFDILGSGTNDWDAGNALINNFSYGKGLTLKQRMFYSNAEWETMLKAEIDAGRPIFYGGTDSIRNGGHAFVCDGYDSNNNFHFNWGWNGQLNGFFPSTALNVLGYQLNQYQDILVNISPNNSDANNYEIVLDEGTTSPMTFTSSKSQVNNNSTDRFNVSAQYYFNNGFTPIKCFLGVALYDQTNKLVQILATATSGNKKAAYDLEPMDYGYGIGWTGITIPPSVPPGNYFIRPIVIDSISNNTIPVHLYSTTSLPLTVKGNGTGLVEINPALKVNVYEANGHIQIMSDASNQIKEIEIYNMQGILVYKEASINAISYTVNKNLPAGIYILQIRNNEQIINRKIIVK